MKQYIILLLLCVVALGANAQDIDKKLDGAKTSYNSKQLEDARFKLQQALAELDIIIGNKILELLPDKMKDLGYNKKGDAVTGTSSGFTGLYVNRSYGMEGTDKEAEVLIISDSPLLTSINAILSMPAVLYAGDPNQKRIKVNGYKALLTSKVDENGVSSFEVQIPVSNSLISFNCNGFSNENDVVAMVNTLPISKIVAVSK